MGWSPSVRRGPAPTPAEVGVRFAKTSPRVWQGNGFADAGAAWVALIGDVVVGEFDGAWSDVFGAREFGRGVRSWREGICREAAKGI